MRKYIVVDQKKHGDMFQTVCDTLEAANAEAKYQWGHLTDQEKTERDIFVGHVEDSEECLWKAYHSLKTEGEYFDSDNL